MSKTMSTSTRVVFKHWDLACTIYDYVYDIIPRSDRIYLHGKLMFQLTAIVSTNSRWHQISTPSCISLCSLWEIERTSTWQAANTNAVNVEWSADGRLPSRPRTTRKWLPGVGAGTGQSAKMKTGVRVAASARSASSLDPAWIRFLLVGSRTCLPGLGGSQVRTRGVWLRAASNQLTAGGTYGYGLLRFLGAWPCRIWGERTKRGREGSGATAECGCLREKSQASRV